MCRINSADFIFVLGPHIASLLWLLLDTVLGPSVSATIGPIPSHRRHECSPTRQLAGLGLCFAFLWRSLAPAAVGCILPSSAASTPTTQCPADTPGNKNATLCLCLWIHFSFKCTLQLLETSVLRPHRISSLLSSLASTAFPRDALRCTKTREPVCAMHGISFIVSRGPIEQMTLLLISWGRTDLISYTGSVSECRA